MKQLPLLLIVLFVSACGSKGNPNAPPSTTPPPTAQTRVIALEGNMDFGAIQIHQSFSATLRILNNGNAPLTITNMTGPGGYASSFTNGTIQAGSAQTATVRFSPTEPRTYNGTLTVNGDHTSGTNTIAISGRGSLDGLPLFTKTGTSDFVFDMPAYISRVRITGTYTKHSSNFIVYIGGRLIVNELLGTGWGTTKYDGTLLTGGGGVVAIEKSSGVAWTLAEVR